MAEKRQSSLFVWLKDVPSPKTAKVSEVRANETGNEEHEEEHGVDELDDYFVSGDSMSEADKAEITESFQDTDSSTETRPVNCTARCCIYSDEPFQPIDKKTLSIFTIKKRNFQPQWYKQFPWVSVCITYKKVYCLYCRHATKRNLISKMGEKAFAETGFQNWRKAIDKFRAHEGSHFHREAKLKWMARGQPTIEAQLSSHLAQLQLTRRNGLLSQLRAIVYLTRQGIAVRGHTELDGNLHHLMQMWSEGNEVVKLWLRENRYTGHQAVNELIEIFDKNVLRNLLKKITDVSGPAWFSVIADQATDIVHAEQLNLSIRWVSDNYEAHEDPVGLCRVPDTKAETLFQIIKDLLIRCNLPLALCRGQAYDGAANMQGRRTGVATRIKNEQPAALPVYCCAHSLNLCLQDAGRKLACLRDALEICRGTVDLIRLSPKRLHLFSSNLQASDSGVGLKPLCPTRWTARTAAIDAILKDYSVIMDTLEEINSTTHDEYGMKAAGFLQSLEKFNTLFGLRLAHTLFCAAEQVSFVLQKKNISLSDALSAVDAAKAYYHRLRSEEEFNRFFDATVQIADKHNIGKPEVPIFRRRPSRFEDGSRPHEFPSARAYYRHTFFEACDLLSVELKDRFEDQHIPSVLGTEKTLLKAANGEDCKDEIALLAKSCYSNDINWSDFGRHILLLHDVIKKGCPSVKKVTSIDTICEAMNSNSIYKEMLPTVHQIIRLYLTVPITSATSERTFSALRRLLTYLRSSMTEKRLNHCLLLHIHKELTDSMDLVVVAKEFIDLYDERKKYFGHF